jgi:hypothetical protein
MNTGSRDEMTGSMIFEVNPGDAILSAVYLFPDH